MSDAGGDIRPVLQRTIGNSLDQIVPATCWVGEVLRAHGCADAVAAQFELCTEEIVTNTIRYGYAEGAAGRLQLTLDPGPEVIELTLQDDGRAFDPLAATLPVRPLSLLDADIGGLGLQLVRTLMECHYTRCDGHNVLRLRKRRGAVAA